MNVPKDTKPMIWGAVIGAALCAVIGFTWGGWVTGGTAQRTAYAAAHEATVTALAPLCAERFRAQDGATAKLAELAKTSTWDRRSAIEKSGFATVPGTTTGDSDLASACVEILLAKPKS
ncbi:MAG: hypothetical protein KIT25_19620 [Enhydrobacter sp.]|nr:MAG: hypothetical protein KIT25_19620 [Enhydrobacter sp.]